MKFLREHRRLGWLVLALSVLLALTAGVWRSAAALRSSVSSAYARSSQQYAEMASGYRSFCRSARDLVTVCRAIDSTGTAAECDALASLLDKLESELDEPFFSVDPETVYDRAAALYTRVADRDTPAGDARFHFKAMKSTLAQLSHNEEYIAAATAYNQKAAGFPMNLFCRQAVLPH